MSFPTQVNVQQAPAVAGDFASRNPRFTVNATQGAFVAGPNGLTIGAFAWADVTNKIMNSWGPGAPTGFIAREIQGTFTDYLAEAGFSILPGQAVTPYSAADVWVMNAGTTSTTVGMKAYANNSTGQITFGPTGTPPTSASFTGSIAKNVAVGSIPTSNTVTGSILGTTLTVTAVGAGAVLGIGQTLSGGSTSTDFVDPGTTIVNQISGTVGGVGTYTVSISQTVAATTITASGGGLTVASITTGTLRVGQTITGTNVPAGTVITGVGAVVAGVGTYTVSTLPTTAVAAATLTANDSTLTVASGLTGTLAVGELVQDGGVNIAAGTYVEASISGTGGLGTYFVTNSQTVASQTCTVNAGTETKWYAMSVGAPGELVIMSAQALG